MTTTASFAKPLVVNGTIRRVPHIRSFSVELVAPLREGFSPGHEYVRRFWAAAIGKGATRDLLELFVAGLRKRTVPEPFYLGVLASAGLIEMMEGGIRMPSRVPLLPPSMVSRLSPHLRSDHRRWTRYARM